MLQMENKIFGLSKICTIKVLNFLKNGVLSRDCSHQIQFDTYFGLKLINVYMDKKGSCTLFNKPNCNKSGKLCRILYFCNQLT